MLSIKLNDKLIQVATNQSLAQILDEQGYAQGYFAVAINQNFIPRSQYATTYLRTGDCIETVAPMQGG